MGINANELWASIENNARLMSLFPAEGQKKVMEEYIKNGFLDAMGDVLAEPVSAKSTIDMQLAYIKDALAKDMFKKMAKATPEDMFGFMSADGFIDVMEGQMSQMIEMLEVIARDVPAFLEANGISEEHLFVQLKMTPDNIKKAMAGNLTIGELLLSQPEVFLDTNKE